MQLTYVGLTRYEDLDRLPLGVVFNHSTFSAKLLSLVSSAAARRGPLAARRIDADMPRPVWRHPQHECVRAGCVRPAAVRTDGLPVE